MQLTPRQVLLRFSHLLRQELIPRLEEFLGPLSPQLQLLSSVAALMPLDRLLSAPARAGRQKIEPPW